MRLLSIIFLITIFNSICLGKKDMIKVEDETNKIINLYLFDSEKLINEQKYFESYTKLISAADLALKNNMFEYATELYIKGLNIRLKFEFTFPKTYPNKNQPFLNLCKLLQQSLSSSAEFWHDQALIHCMDDNDTSCILQAFTSYSLYFTNHDQNDIALKITEKGLPIAKDYNDTLKYARILLDYSDLLNKVGKYEKALEICAEGYQIIKIYEDNNLTINDYHWSLFFIELKAYIRYNQNLLKESEALFISCLDSINAIKNRGGIDHSDIQYITSVRLGKLYIDIGEAKKADELFIFAEDLKNNPENRGFNSILLFENMIFTYSKAKDFKKAFKASEKYRDYIYQSYLAAIKQHNESRRDLATLNIQNAQKEIHLLKEKAEKAGQNNKIMMLSICLLIFGGIALTLYLVNRQKQRNNVSLITKNRLIINQKNEITSSIEYAEKIQNAILPSREVMKKHLNDCFVFYLPRDIVSGDFYWIHPTEEKVLLACADCTGHGVPGAIVSMIGNNGLNNCVLESNLTKPNEILNKLNDYIEKTFIKSEHAIYDGMDIALVSFDPETLHLEYSGANIPLYIVRDNEVIVLKPNKQPIGKFDHHKPFELQHYNLLPNDMVYMFSDGIQDQFGGPKNKKFKIGNLKKLLVKMSNLPSDEQLELLSMSFFDWQREYEQVDDLCFVAFRV